jgi:hypothetical protein
MDLILGMTLILEDSILGMILFITHSILGVTPLDLAIHHSVISIISTIGIILLFSIAGEEIDRDLTRDGLILLHRVKYIKIDFQDQLEIKMLETLVLFQIHQDQMHPRKLSLQLHRIVVEGFLTPHQLIRIPTIRILMETLNEIPPTELHLVPERHHQLLPIITVVVAQVVEDRGDSRSFYNLSIE